MRQQLRQQLRQRRTKTSLLSSPSPPTAAAAPSSVTPQRSSILWTSGRFRRLWTNGPDQAHHTPNETTLPTIAQHTHFFRGKVIALGDFLIQFPHCGEALNKARRRALRLLAMKYQRWSRVARPRGWDRLHGGGCHFLEVLFLGAALVEQRHVLEHVGWRRRGVDARMPGGTAALPARPRRVARSSCAGVLSNDGLLSLCFRRWRSLAPARRVHSRPPSGRPSHRAWNGRWRRGKVPQQGDR